MSITSIFVLALSATPAPEVDCAALYGKHLASDMELSWREFDQTEGSGFRVLAGAGCPREAADLIDAYLVEQQRLNHSLHWHTAQMRAEAGQTDEAVAAARRSRRSDEPADAEFKWNDYVSAVIAFLERDRAAFDRHRSVLASHEGNAGNAMNLKFLGRLDAGFDRSYRDAISAEPARNGGD